MAGQPTFQVDFRGCGRFKRSRPWPFLQRQRCSETRARKRPADAMAQIAARRLRLGHRRAGEPRTAFAFLSVLAVRAAAPAAPDSQLHLPWSRDESTAVRAGGIQSSYCNLLVIFNLPDFQPSWRRYLRLIYLRREGHDHWIKTMRTGPYGAARSGLDVENKKEVGR